MGQGSARAVLLAVLLLGVSLTGCTTDTAPEGPGTPGNGGSGSTDGLACAAPGTGHQAVALSPRDYDEHFESFFAQASAAADVIGWGGVIDEIGEEGSAPHVVAQLCSEHDYGVFIQTSPFRQDEAGFAVPFGESQRASLIEDLVAFVDERPVQYLGLGVEVNYWWEEASQEDWETFVAWYDQAYDAVKEASPQTRVFPTFQYERMIGMHGGLWGGENGQPSQWAILDAFPQRDLTAFTTYPGLLYKDPDEIPGGYWDPIGDNVSSQERSRAPIAFTETGWNAEGGPEGWEGNATDQAAYLDRFIEAAERYDAALSIWLFLYDQPAEPAFEGMGLRADDGQPRPAYEAWDAW